MKSVRNLIIGLVIAAGALYYTLHNVSMKDLAASFKTVDYVYIVPAVFIMLLSYFFRALRWRILISPMKQVDVSGLFSPLMVGYMANILPARAGELVRAYLLGNKHGIPFSGAFASIIVGITSLPDARELRGVGLKTFLYYFSTTALAVTIGLVAVLTIQPGKKAGSQTPRAEREEQLAVYRED
ncbi:MAG: flippase-like domain-containing protein, partial [Nitrospinae bacterium]|nr:flippase-like domain-containing protein [Nitrospinota bacterium]